MTARYASSTPGVLSADDFRKAAVHMGCASASEDLFRSLADVDGRCVRCEVVMQTITSKISLTDDMRIFLIAIACEPGPSSPNGAMKRRVWRAGPRPEQPPSSWWVLRRQLMAAAHATVDPRRGQRDVLARQAWSRAKSDREHALEQREEHLLQKSESAITHHVRPG